MKNAILISVAVMGILVVGLGTFASVKKPLDPNIEMKTAYATIIQERKGAQSDGAATNNLTSPRYMEFDRTNFDQASGTRRILFFYASWCPTCLPANASLNENAGSIPSDVTVFRVNFNDPETDQEEKDLAKKYDVAYQHTFVQVDSQGNEVASWNGGQIRELLSSIK